MAEPGRALRILVSAGEPSGDHHGAQLIGALRERWPGAEIAAFGGPRLAATGAVMLRRMEPYTALGLVEVVGAIPRHLRLLGEFRRRIRRREFDLVILIDYPGFHLRVAEAARAVGIPVLYYVAPQLWAWRPGRARRFARAVDAMAAILPFEAEFLADAGIQAEFVGHPLVEAPWPSRADARSALGIAQDERVLALFPGSRGGEVRRLWPTLCEAGRRLRAAGQCDRVLVAADSAAGPPDSGAMQVHRGESALGLAAADAVIAKSGTTTLEAAMTGTPMVVVYRVHPVTAWLARRMLRVNQIGLVNLVAGRPVVPELVQEALSVDRLVAAVAPLLDRAGAAAASQREALGLVRSKLGEPGAARRVAAMAARLLGQ
jgi:lipid-A-disaccharide synthase